GLTKLVNRGETRRMLAEFGVPAPFTASGALLLPLAELAVAVALVPVATAWWGAVGALALLLLFIVAVTATLARGRRPDCNCFGQLASAPIGAGTILRNAALAAVAAFVVLRGRNDAGASAFAWLVDLSGFERGVVLGGSALLALLAIEGWVLLQVIAQDGRLLTRLEALETQPPRPAAPPS